MTRSLLNRTFALFVLMVFTIETFGMSVNLHYCQGELFSMNLFGEADKCQMFDQDENQTVVHPCCKKRLEKSKNQKDPKFEKPCCSDKTVQLSNGDIESPETNFNNYQIDKFLVPTARVQELNFIHFLYPKVILHNSDPPIIAQNVIVLHQVFRI